jgi:hypothetical protein
MITAAEEFCELRKRRGSDAEVVAKEIVEIMRVGKDTENLEFGKLKELTLVMLRAIDIMEPFDMARYSKHATIFPPFTHPFHFTQVLLCLPYQASRPLYSFTI